MEGKAAWANSDLIALKTFEMSHSCENDYSFNKIDPDE